MRINLAVLLLLVGLSTPSWSSSTSIGVFFDADATDCDLTVPPFGPFVPFTVWVYALLGTDAAGGGITGAEFRIDGLEDLVWSVTPNPEAFAAVGNPCQGGCNIGFPTCMVGNGLRHAVPLYTIECLPVTSVTPRLVRVDRHTAPCGACGPVTQLVTLCDSVFTHLNVRGGEARINSGSCTVGVQPTAWSQVKMLFRD